MKKFKLYTYTWAILALISLQACNLSETNIDPTRQTGSELSLILPSALTHTAFNQSANPARVAGIVMQQFEGFDAQQVDYTNYVIGDVTFNNYWRTGLYAGVLKDCDVLIKQAQEEGQPYYEGIAKILMASEYATAASFFGDIPLTEALQGNDNLQPAYDSQAFIYETAQTMLDEAISLLGMDPVPGGPGSDDLIYGGDAASWIAVAHALKARYYMHLSKRDGEAATKALAELSKTFGSLAEQPDFAWENNTLSNSPLAKFGQERPNTLLINSAFKMAMDANADPRASFYSTEDFKYWGTADLFWAQNNSVIPLISYVEVAFLKAEAMLATGSPIADVEAQLEMGIEASMDQMGMAPEDYADYVSTAMSMEGLSEEEALEHIMEEAYYAYFGFAFQQIWTNYRRTGYPDLTPNPVGVNGLNPSGVIPTRFLYPVSEAQTNSANLNAAISAQGWSAGLLDDGTWAFK
ncbi:SusD/RagB family nutrient-binding outer membrane lipoprotein [Pontibacter sp. G13]|uniref:SusD/RagB family nutrient-binding outer membrane lipoprotein n=1 Tax=Pontibacter sp. G13 TaxID=3074898 RepID=UPI00288B3B0E|nr:SusD/RagB family nutrient-binding outer membrane lipoprotein [Pontibacter sp. G13]WNJ20169.1 SusD/RagB family nutrient-binding outer membrane lipoprotein [Pontibacter sp. G13]